jgi:7-cyano-7-deazaguanine reductase
MTEKQQIEIRYGPPEKHIDVPVPGELQSIKLNPVEHPFSPVTINLMRSVKFTSDEVTALCPLTDQPDQYTVGIEFGPQISTLESKSLKLYFQKYRNKGIFAEQLAQQVCTDVVKCVTPRYCHVIVLQKSRGGISLEASAAYGQLIHG